MFTNAWQYAVEKYHTNKCGHVLEVVTGSPGDVSQTKDGAVRVELLIISAILQIGIISCVKNVGPQGRETHSRTVIYECPLLTVHSSCFQLRRQHMEMLWRGLSTDKENLLWKWEFRKLDEIFDVDGEVFSICQQRPTVKKKTTTKNNKQQHNTNSSIKAVD